MDGLMATNCTVEVAGMDSPSAQAAGMVRKEQWCARNTVFFFPIVAEPLSRKNGVWSVGAEIAHEVALTHEVMQLWDEVLPGKVLHVRYEDLVANQARCRAP